MFIRTASRVGARIFRKMGLAEVGGIDHPTDDPMSGLRFSSVYAPLGASVREAVACAEVALGVGPLRPMQARLPWTKVGPIALATRLAQTFRHRIVWFSAPRDEAIDGLTLDSHDTPFSFPPVDRRPSHTRQRWL